MVMPGIDPITGLPKKRKRLAYAFDYQTGQFVETTEEEVAKRESYYKLSPLIAPPGTPGKVTPAQLQRYQEQVFSNPDGFMKNLQNLSESDMRQALVNIGATDNETEELVREISTGRVRAREDEIFSNVFPGMNKQAVIDTAAEDFSAFLKAIQKKGRSPDTEDLLKLLGYSDEEVANLFAPLAQPPTLKGIEWGVPGGKMISPLQPPEAGAVPEPPPETTEKVPTADEFAAQYFAERGWDFDYSKITRAKPADEYRLKAEYDRRLAEATNTYKEKYGTGAFLRSAAAKAVETVASPFWSKQFIQPGREEPTGLEKGLAAIDILALLPFGIIFKAGKFVPRAWNVAKAADKVAMVKTAGLADDVATKAAKELTDQEIKALSEAIPKAAPGMPEAELKPSAPVPEVKPPAVEAPLVKEVPPVVAEGAVPPVKDTGLENIRQVLFGEQPPVQPTPVVPFKGVNISTVDEITERIAKQKIGGKVGKVLQVPVVKQAGKLVKPIAISDEPGTVLSGMSGMIDDQINGATILAMSKPTREMGAAGKLFNLDANGVSLANDIKQLKPLPNGTNSMAMHDIVEFAPWYDFGVGEVGKARKQLVDTIRETSEQMGVMLRKEGILVDGTAGPGQIKAMKGESGWSFLHRVVTEVKEEAADSVARNLTQTLQKEGIIFAKQAKESNFQFLSRFAESVKVGATKPTEEINKLLDQFGKLADVKVKKTTLEAKRSWDTVAEGMKAGVTYEPNPLVELRKQVRASYDLVKKKRLGETINKLIETTTPIEKAAAELGVDYDKVVKAKAVSERLVSYFQRAIRGESLPGGATIAVRKDFPELAQDFDDAMALLPKQKEVLLKKAMTAAKKAAKITATDAESIAQRTETLANIELAFKQFGTVPKITRADIIEVLQQTISDKTKASKAIREIYLGLSESQKEILNNILGKAKVLAKTHAGKLKQIDDLAAKFSERMGPLGTVEYGRIPGLPGLGGRVIVPQRGKLGQEIADEIRQHFGYLPKSGADKAVEATGLLGGVMRMARLGFDLSATLIQQALSLGYDVRNLVKLKPTAVWVKATGGAVRSAVSRNVDHLESFLIKNEDIVRDYIQRGGLIESAEFTEAAGPLRGLIGKIPNEKIQTIASAIGKHVLGRSDAVFTTGRVEAGVNMYKAGYKAMERAGKLDEWARLTNNMTGVLSTRAMGIGSSQRNIESALGFMSPRFTRANGAILWDIITNPAGYTAKEAGTSLAALIASGTAIYLAGNAAQNKDVTLNPFDPDFGNLRIGERVYRLGGIISDMRRVLTAIDALTYFVSGERLSLSGKEDRTLPLDKLGFQMFQSKTSPITGTAIDVVRMLTDKYGIERDYEGRPLSWQNILGNWISPSWTDSLLNNEPDVALGSIGNIIGLNTYVPFTGNWKEDFAKLGLPKNQDGEPYGLIPIVYKTNDFWAANASRFKDTEPETVTEKQGYAPYIRKIAEAQQIISQLEQYPNVKLTSLEKSDPVTGATFSEYYQQWQDSLNITDKKELAEFDKKYPKAHLGNFSLRELDLLRQYHALSPTDTAGRKAFELEHPEVTKNPYDEYLKAHPDENAKLALWGQVAIMSAKAYDAVQKLAVDLDVPDRALPDFKMDGIAIPKDDETRKSFFEYQETTDKYGSGSPEAHLLLAKNEKLRKAVGRETQKLAPIPALEIDVKNRSLNDKYEALTSDKDRAAFLEANPKYADDKARISAYKKQYAYDNTVADKKTVDSFVEYDKSGEGNEKTLYRIDHPDFDAAWSKVEGWQPVDVKSVDALRLKVKNKVQTLAFDKLPTAEARTVYLLANKDYALDTFRIKGFDAGIPKEQIEKYAQKEYKDTYYNTLNDTQQEAYLKSDPAYHLERVTEKGTNAGVSENYMPAYTKYEMTPTDGQARERLLQADPEYYQNVYLDILGGKYKKLGTEGGPVDFTKVASEKFETAYRDVYSKKATDREKDLFRYLNPDFEKEGLAIGKFTSPVLVKSVLAQRLSIANQTLDAQYNRIVSPADQRAFLNTNPQYKLSRIAIKGLNDGVPENFINDYVTWKAAPMSRYALERFMSTHLNFYNQVYKKILGEGRLDFRNILSESLEAQLNTYNDLRGKKKTAYLKSHSALRRWMERRAKLRPSQATDMRP